MAKKKPITADLLGQVPNGNDVLMQPVPYTPMQSDLANYDMGAAYRSAMASEPPPSVAGMYAAVPGVRDNLLRSPAPAQPQDRHPGMPPSVANFNGRQIVDDAANKYTAAQRAQLVERDVRRPQSTPTEGAYVPSGIAPRGGVRTGDPFLDVNTDFGALAADQAVKDANDQAFTQMNRGRMSGIAASREAANGDRASRLQRMGKTPDEIERIMYPERFTDLQAEARNQVMGRKMPANMSDQAFAETQGRIGATSRADMFMRKARLNGQNMGYAQAYGMAQNDFPTTGPDTVGNPSLPAVSPGRQAFFNPQAGYASGSFVNGNQKNANDHAAEMGRQGLAAQEQQNSNARSNREIDIKQQQADTADWIAKQSGQTGLASQQAALTWLSNPANAMHMGTPLWDAMVRQASGAAVPGTGSAQAPAAPAGGAPAGGAPAPAGGGLPNRDAFLASSPQAMNAHLNAFADPNERLREQARIYAHNGQGNHPAVRQYLMQRFAQDDPNLAWGPDHWSQAYDGGQSVVNWLFGDKPIAGRAADYAAQNYGIPADVALPHFQNYYGRM